MSVLEEIAAHARERVWADAEINSPEVLRELASQGGAADGAAFRNALKKSGLSFICEVKRAFPSKGLIAKSFPYVKIAEEYEGAGADAVSCLTEPKWFQGSDAIFREIRSAIRIPMLRKDFTVDAYQIYQEKVMGANAVLLICALLDTNTLQNYLSVCADLGLAALVEAHDEREIVSAVSAGAEIIGVNNRNLKDFTVDFSNAARLRALTDGKPVWKAFRVRTAADVEAARRSTANRILLANGAGTGAAFDWTLVREMGRPWILARGLTPEKLREAAHNLRPWCVNLSGGVETNGVKDRTKILEAVEAVRKL